MKRLFLLFFCCCLVFGTPATAYSLYSDENPFVEAMLRMMEIFGLIDRSRLPLGVPYLPSYGQSLAPGLGMGGLPGMTGVPGMTGFSGLSPLYGLGAMPGASSFPATGGWPTAGGWPGAGLTTMATPGYRPDARWPGVAPTRQPPSYLDGIWEISKGGFVVIRGNAARLYVARDQYQDFAIAYDRQHLWWAPQAGGKRSRYQYQVRSGRMVMRDTNGNYLLLRRRR